MNKNIQDERFLVAEEAICQAFYEIAQKKTLERITVSDVIKKAGIVRSTFYNHYEGIPDLLDAVEDQTIHHLFTMMDQFHVKKSTPQDNSVIILRFYQNLCSYIRENPFLAQLLGSPRGDAFFETQPISPAPPHIPGRRYLSRSLIPLAEHLAFSTNGQRKILQFRPILSQSCWQTPFQNPHSPIWIDHLLHLYLLLHGQSCPLHCAQMGFSGQPAP